MEEVREVQLTKLPEVWPFPTSTPTPLTEKQLRQIAYDEAEEALL